MLVFSVGTDGDGIAENDNGNMGPVGGKTAEYAITVLPGFHRKLE
jgi:hypothetical protein